MAQIELNVLGELKTSTRQHKIRWERATDSGSDEWTTDIGSYEFVLMEQESSAPLLRIIHSDDEVAVIDGPEVTSLLRYIREEAKALATEEKKARLAQVLTALEAHREADRGAFFARS